MSFPVAMCGMKGGRWIGLVCGAWLLVALPGRGEAPHQDGGTDVFGRRYPRVVFEEEKLIRAGLHKITGEHLTLYTDVLPDPEIQQLSAVFDAAYPQWCAFFGVSPGSKPWRMRGFLMRDGELFRRLGVLPAWLPPFANGYSVGDLLWIYEQKSAYYRRHLLIHEGTHGFLRAHTGEGVPPWYNEGVAELLGTHLWDGNMLRLAWVPRSRDEVPLWGRVKIVRDAVAAGQPLSVPDVLNFGPTAHRTVEPYGWCWALTALLEHDPRLQPVFRRLPQVFNRQDFNRQFIQLLGDQWLTLQYQWLVVLAELDYGYDFSRMATDFLTAAASLVSAQATQVDAARGWQNTGWVLEAGRSYRLTASGRFVVARDERPWESEPQGVTIRYVRGRPLGALLAAVVPVTKEGPNPEEEINTEGSFFRPWLVGRAAELTPPRSGVLFLRINDSPAELDDNSGSVTVRMEPSEAGR